MIIYYIIYCFRSLHFYGLGFHPLREDKINKDSNMIHTLKLLQYEKEKIIHQRKLLIANNINNLRGKGGHNSDPSLAESDEMLMSSIPSLASNFKKWDNNTANNNKRINTQGIAMVLVDMPGYGFSYMNNNDNIRVKNLCNTYLCNRGSNLKRVILLLDARHGFKLGDKVFFKSLFEGERGSERGSERGGGGWNDRDSNSSSERGDRGKSDRMIGQERSDSSLGSSSSLADRSYTNSNTKTGSKKKRGNIHWKLQIVLTKCDLLDRMELARRIQVIIGIVYIRVVCLVHVVYSPTPPHPTAYSLGLTYHLCSYV